MRTAILEKSMLLNFGNFVLIYNSEVSEYKHKFIAAFESILLNIKFIESSFLKIPYSSSTCHENSNQKNLKSPPFLSYRASSRGYTLTNGKYGGISWGEMLIMVVDTIQIRKFATIRKAMICKRSKSNKYLNSS